MQIGFYLWDKLLYVFLKTTKGRCGQQLKFTINVNWNGKLNLFWMSKSKNSNFVIRKKFSCHFPSMVAMEPWKKHIWTFDFELQTLQWTSIVERMMTSATWQFPHNFWNGGVVRLVMDNTLSLEK
jgi:hypothetical protein